MVGKRNQPFCVQYIIRSLGKYLVCTVSVLGLPKQSKTGNIASPWLWGDDYPNNIHVMHFENDLIQFSIRRPCFMPLLTGFTPGLLYS